MLAAEWRADSQALASDGQYWRSVYGGARLVLGCIRVTPALFAVMRVVFLALSGCIFFLEITNSEGEGAYWFLYFHHWVLGLQVVYFALTAVLTVVAVCTAGSGGIARTTPFYVRITELAYGALVPASWVAFLLIWGVQYLQHSHCTSVVDKADYVEEAALYGAALLLVLLDTGFNRQPYYASFHAIIGIIFLWGWLIFSFVWELLGGHDQWGHSYIYRCLDWSYPIKGGHFNAEGKLMILNFFILIPIFNFTYWLLIWAKRRTLTIYKKVEAPPTLQQPLTQTPRPPVNRRTVFEYAADFRDLALDGRHWRAQFGGASSPKAPKMGAYLCCGARTYPLFRLAMAGLAACFLLFTVWRFQQDAPVGQWYKAALYFDTWTLLLSAVYFGLAALLTTFAACTDGAESSSTPLIVWLTWACYGALLPAAMLNAFICAFVTTPCASPPPCPHLAALPLPWPRRRARSPARAHPQAGPAHCVVPPAAMTQLLADGRGRERERRVGPLL